MCNVILLLFYFVCDDFAYGSMALHALQKGNIIIFLGIMINHFKSNNLASFVFVFLIEEFSVYLRKSIDLEIVLDYMIHRSFCKSCDG